MVDNNKSAVPVVTVGNEGNALRFEAVQQSTQVGGADLFDNGQIPFQYAPGALIFSATSGVWYQQRELVQFCDTGWDQYFGTESGYLSSQKPGRGMTSMQLNGYPGRKLPFIVQSLGIIATLPYVPAVASGTATVGSGTSITASKDGPQAANCQNIAEQLFRNALDQSYVEYEIDQNCKRYLGRPEFFPGGVGISDSLVFRSSPGPAVAAARVLFPREAIVLPKSTSDNQLQHLFKLRLVAQSATAGHGTPADPAYAAPTDGDDVVMPVYLILQGAFGVYEDASETVVVPADGYEAARLANNIAKSQG